MQICRFTCRNGQNPPVRVGNMCEIPCLLLCKLNILPTKCIWLTFSVLMVHCLKMSELRINPGALRSHKKRIEHCAPNIYCNLPFALSPAWSSLRCNKQDLKSLEGRFHGTTHKWWSPSVLFGGPVLQFYSSQYVSQLDWDQNCLDTRAPWSQFHTITYCVSSMA